MKSDVQGTHWDLQKAVTELGFCSRVLTGLVRR